MQVTGENAFTYSYNGRNQLNSVTNPNSVQLSFSYDNGGGRTRITDPGSYVEYVYNARNWITDVRNRTTGGTTRYDAAHYYNDGSTWDNVGNPLKRTENIAGSTYTTTLRYDAVYRETEETKRDSSNNVVYSLTYGYDACGNRTSRTLNGTTTNYGYDDSNKLTTVNSTTSCDYDGNGNLTHTYNNLPNQWMWYNDSNYLTHIRYGGGPTDDYYYYTNDGRRYRATLAGNTYRYLYDGARVLEELNDSGSTMYARYTTENGSYYGALLHLYRSSGTLSRFPMYDNIGTVRGLVDVSGAVTDTYELDTFGRSVSSSGSTPNPYRFGGAWGYVTDPSGMLQLGVRHYWPELGKFLQQDPSRQERNWYAYAANDPLATADPTGLMTTSECLNIAWGHFQNHVHQLLVATTAAELIVLVGAVAAACATAGVSALVLWTAEASAACNGATVLTLINTAQFLIIYELLVQDYMIDVKACLRQYPMCEDPALSVQAAHAQ